MDTSSISNRTREKIMNVSCLNWWASNSTSSIKIETFCFRGNLYINDHWDYHLQKQRWNTMYTKVVGMYKKLNIFCFQCNCNSRISILDQYLSLTNTTFRTRTCRCLDDLPLKCLLESYIEESTEVYIHEVLSFFIVKTNTVSLSKQVCADCVSCARLTLPSRKWIFIYLRSMSHFPYI